MERLSLAELRAVMMVLGYAHVYAATEIVFINADRPLKARWIAFQLAEAFARDGVEKYLTGASRPWRLPLDDVRRAIRSVKETGESSPAGRP